MAGAFQAIHVAKAVGESASRGISTLAKTKGWLNRFKLLTTPGAKFAQDAGLLASNISKVTMANVPVIGRLARTRYYAHHMMGVGSAKAVRGVARGAFNLGRFALNPKRELGILAKANTFMGRNAMGGNLFDKYKFMSAQAGNYRKQYGATWWQRALGLREKATSAIKGIDAAGPSTGLKQFFKRPSTYSVAAGAVIAGAQFATPIQNQRENMFGDNNPAIRQGAFTSYRLNPPNRGGLRTVGPGYESLAMSHNLRQNQQLKGPSRLEKSTEELVHSLHELRHRGLF
jgi:hypothetical protein